ncbi:DUF58 domain-containing protein [Massilia endophytica]|uniref:DUF58 domain-containing protein n=1 Tax=Massilia endophytica TaxID=2899220 RepID=UPI001E52B628|nr:DUF58 domain-containing protein [Massilia endophytica]UGQ46686.1 DUF58 domain-containing protein [Massilia endophytica]
MLDTSALLAHSANLDLVIRHVLAGLGHGIHAGRERGAGVEFSEYRAYAPGDEWRRVDWKLLARADRYYVREAERDSHVAVWLWLDASASMAEPSRSVEGLDKLWFARTALACVAAIAQRQGDAFGLIVCSDGKAEFTPASRGPRQLQRVLSALSRTRASGRLPSEAATRGAMQFLHAPAMVFAASDFLDWPSPLGESLLRLRRMRHDVRLLALQTEAEATGGFRNGAAYRDPELPEGLHRFDKEGRESYVASLSAHMTAVSAACRKNDVPLAMACIEQPLAQVLRQWLRTERLR